MNARRRLLLGAMASIGFAAGPGLANAPTKAPLPTVRPPMPVLTGVELAEASGLSGVVAFMVADLASGEVLEASLEDLPLPPASVSKAVTAIYALDALGPDYRFETRVAAVGPRTGGVLNGDLILQGAGDPELDTSSLNELATDLAQRGLRQVSGRFLVDAELLPAIEMIDADQPIHATYNASIGALNLNFNRVHVTWRRENGEYVTSVEAKADGMSPPTSQARLEVAPRTETGVLDYSLENGVEVWRATARTLGRAGARHVPTRRPADYAARTFRDLAQRTGLSLPPHEPGAAPVVAEVLARYESPPLSEIVRDMLRYSTNLTAESLGLAATRARGGGAFALSESAAAMNAWAANFAGFAAGDGGLKLENHSGLSLESRASARRIVELLTEADGREFPTRFGGPSATLMSVLPIKSYHDRNAPDPDRPAIVRAKTGTLSFVNALAGYLHIDGTSPAAPKRRLAFAIIASDIERRRRVSDRNVENPPGSDEFAATARRLQRAMIRSWISRFSQ